MYAKAVCFVQRVLTALGMAQALHDAGMWDEPPLESWEHVQAAAESPAERAAEREQVREAEGGASGETSAVTGAPHAKRARRENTE